MTIENIFTELNKGDFYSERNISGKFRTLLGNSEVLEEKVLKEEIMAFEFLENNRNRSDWGTYFGSYHSLTTANGKKFESPSIEDIDCSTIEHWTNRAKQAKNPVLKARYSGLVWDFGKKINGANPDIKIADIYINSLLTIVENRLQQNLELITKIERALLVSISINNKEYIDKAKTEILRLESDIGENKSSGFWGFSFDLLINNKNTNLLKNEEFHIISELENRLKEVTSGVDFNTSGAESIVKRLAKYYKNKNKIEESKRVIKVLGVAKKIGDKNKSGMQKLHSLRLMQKLYFEYGLRKESEESLKNIRLIGGNIHKDMKKVTSTFEISIEKINNLVNIVTSGSIEDVFNKLIDAFVPKLEFIENAIKEDSKINPLSYIISNSLFDAKGREVAKIGTLENDFNGHIYKFLSTHNQLTSIYLNRVFDKMLTELEYTSTTFIDYIKESPTIKNERIEILKKGIEAYFNEDYLVCNHLLIPQIEEGIRNLIELNGGVVLKPSNLGGFYLKTLNELLSDDIFKNALSKDYQVYFKSLFTDARGWNLRNNICHGLSESFSFNRNTSERLIHTVLILGSIRFSNS